VDVCMVYVHIVQAERAKPTANLSLFTSDELFASAVDSPTFDLFAPAAVSILVTISFVHLCAFMCYEISKQMHSFNTETWA